MHRPLPWSGLPKNGPARSWLGCEGLDAEPMRPVVRRSTRRRFTAPPSRSACAPLCSFSVESGWIADCWRLEGNLSLEALLQMPLQMNGVRMVVGTPWEGNQLTVERIVGPAVLEVL